MKPEIRQLFSPLKLTHPMPEISVISLTLACEYFDSWREPDFM